MNLDSLLPNLGEWLKGTGPDSDVVVSTRLRLARNLADYPFAGRAAGPQKTEIEQKVREAVAAADLAAPLAYLSVSGLPALDRDRGGNALVLEVPAVTSHCVLGDHAAAGHRQRLAFDKGDLIDEL